MSLPMSWPSNSETKNKFLKYPILVMVLFAKARCFAIRRDDATADAAKSKIIGNFPADHKMYQLQGSI